MSRRSGTEGKQVGPPAPSETRRFDVFAEWNRLKALEDLRLSPSDAKAYGLAVAKIVAGRRGMPGGARRPPLSASSLRAPSDRPGGKWWRSFGSAREFDGAIVGRMGREFYWRTFRPALREAWGDGLDYLGIRDSLRGEWNRSSKRSFSSIPRTPPASSTRRRRPSGPKRS